MKKLTNEEFVRRAKKIHGKKYDYSNCFYEHSLKKVSIKCPLHGPFLIKPSNHINNKQGCWECGNESTGALQKKSLKVFLKQVHKKPNSKMYDFSQIKDFKNNRDTVKIICNIHGEYNRSPRDILRSKYFGCKKCKLLSDRHDNEIFLQKARVAHGDHYEYHNAEYVKSHESIVVTCKKHGDFETKPYMHVAGGGFCPKCTKFVSSYEIELNDYISSKIEDEIKTTYKKIKDINEIDIFIESLGLAFEFDGLYWHSDLFKSKKYHLEKTKKLNDIGIRLIHIFEDEWNQKKDICKSMITNILGKTEKKIYARNCHIKKVDSSEAKNFLESNHIQGFCPSSHRYGLYYEGSLVALMTFGKNRICLGQKAKPSEYELLRFCSSKFTNVVGGASKLFNYFVCSHSPQKITSYCDIRWGSGILYMTLGFKRTKDTPPNYYYVKGNKRYGRFGFRKNILVSKGHSPLKTERQIMLELGYNRIYDCGSMKFEWNPIK